MYLIHLKLPAIQITQKRLPSLLQHSARVGIVSCIFHGAQSHPACPPWRTTPVTTKVVRLSDGRQVAVQESGKPSGHPVFLMHGTPGSRVGPLPRSFVLHGLGVRLITFDRPGYGRSDRLESRLVADVAPDVEAIADALGIDQFAVLGRSGGGPHALACAALLPHRVTRAGVLVSLAPWAADGLDWFAGMADSNVAEFKTAATKPEALTEALVRTAADIRANPVSHVSTLGQS